METFSYKDSIIGAVESFIGGRKENQDSYGTATTPAGMLVVVCDGMGGGPAGKTASTLATQAIIDYVSGAPTDRNPSDIMHEAGKAANEAVIGAVEKDPSLMGMGTTCVCVLLTGRKAYIMHVGDSRCYQLRKGHSIFRTSDHSYVGAMVKSGQMTEEEARTSSHSNIITRAIGIDRDLIIDVDTVDYEPGDRFALMSDGIWGAMPEPQLIVSLSSSEGPSQIVEEMTGRVDRIGINKGGTHDNLTLALVEVIKGNKTSKQISSETKTSTGMGKVAAAISNVGTPKEVNKKDYSPIDEKKQKTRRQLAVVVLCTFFVVFAFCMVYIFILSDKKGGEEAKEERKKTEQLHEMAQEKQQEAQQQEEQVNREPEKPAQNSSSELAEQITKPNAQTPALIQTAISKLQQIKDYNKDNRIQIRKSVIQAKTYYYNQACNAVAEAIKSCGDESQKAKLEEILTDLRTAKGKITMTSSSPGIHATGEAIQVIDSYVSKLNRVAQ